MSCMKGSCLEFLVAPLFQRAKESPQPLANPPNMPRKGPVGSFHDAWHTNRKTETQMVKSGAEEEISQNHSTEQTRATVFQASLFNHIF